MAQQKILTPIARLLGARSDKWLIHEVEAHHEKPHEGRPDPGWFHPSDLSTTCDAALAFAYLGVKQKKVTPAKLQRIFDHGSGRDEYWKRYLHDTKISLHKHWGGSPAERKLASAERHIQIEHCRVRGEYDDRIANRAKDGEQYIFEFKTKREDLFDKLRAPDPDHVLQTHPYMFATGVLQAYILYECKNCQDLKEFVVPFSTETWRGIEERCLRIMELCATRQTPERIPLRNDSECGWYHVCATHDFTKAAL